MVIKKRFFVFCFLFCIICFIGIVSADVLSINSGGASDFIVSPSSLIEGFFFGFNHLPVVSNVTLFSSSGENSTLDNLTVDYVSFDFDGDNLTNITDWRVNGDSISVLNMPFDTRIISRDEKAIRDYSTYENNGTLGGGNVLQIPNYEENCQIGGCYSFDGVDDYVEVGDILDLGNTFTISLWTKPNSFSLYNPLIFRDGNTKNNLGLRFDSAGNIEFRQYNGGEVRTVQSYGVGAWVHVVAVSDNLGGKIYVNGVSKATGVFVEPFSDIGNIRIGKYSYDVGWNFNGSIDNVQIFNRALSEEQIKEIYQAGLNHHNVENLVSNETDRGEVWQVAVTPNDKYGDGETVLSNNLTIENVNPEDPEPYLYSENGRNETNSNLICTTPVYDVEGDLLNVSVIWKRNSTSILTINYNNYSSGDTFEAVLDKGNLSLGDIWVCSVRTYDGVEYSNWVDSNELEIIDITSPNVTIISPEPINYTSLNISYNVSLNEEGHTCFYNLDDLGNFSMDKLNLTYFGYWDLTLGPGEHEIWFYCNDTSGNWGSNYTIFNIENEAAIAISLSDALQDAIRWNVLSLPADDLDAIGNNLNSSTDYYLNISTTNTLIDLYIRADSDLFNSGGDKIGLGNETFSFSITDATIPGGPTHVMNTSWIKIGEGLSDDVLYLKFYLDAPVSQPVGQYVNQLNFKALRHGQSL